jgi:hypothetical protein
MRRSGGEPAPASLRHARTTGDASTTVQMHRRRHDAGGPDGQERSARRALHPFERPPGPQSPDPGPRSFSEQRFCRSWGCGGESACTPDSVSSPEARRWPSLSAGGYPTALAAYPGVGGRAALPLLGLAPGGVYRAARVAPGAGALLPHRFTLACAGDSAESSAIGGLFSVALSCESPRLGVTQHLALWSPDVPRPGRSPRERAPGRGHPADSPPPPLSRASSRGSAAKERYAATSSRVSSEYGATSPSRSSGLTARR